MKKYSFTRNLRYVAMACYRPGDLMDEFALQSSLWYGIVPYFVTTLVYELLYWLSYLRSVPSANPFPKLLPIPDRVYALYQILFAPLVNAAGVVVFGGVIYGLSRVLRFEKVAAVKVVAFFMFISIVGLLSAAVDLASMWWPLDVLAWVHPLVGLIVLVYGGEFIHRQSGLNRWKSFALLLPAWMAYFLLRSLFVR